MAKFEAHCICGGSMKGRAPHYRIPEILAVFRSVHTGEGHAPCEAKTAAAARRRNEAQDERAAEEKTVG